MAETSIYIYVARGTLPSEFGQGGKKSKDTALVRNAFHVLGTFSPSLYEKVLLPIQLKNNLKTFMDNVLHCWTLRTVETLPKTVYI